jgi:hypothetical protein
MAQVENLYVILSSLNQALGRHKFDPTHVAVGDFHRVYEGVMNEKGLRLRPEMAKAIKDASIPHICLRGVLGICSTMACQDCREIKSSIAATHATNYGKEFQPVKLPAASKKKATMTQPSNLSLSATNQAVKTVGAKPGSKSAIRAAKGQVKLVERKPRQIKAEIPPIIAATSVTTTSSTSTIASSPEPVRKMPVYGSKTSATKKSVPPKGQQTVARSKSAKKKAARANKANKYGSKTSCSKPAAKKTTAPRRRKGTCTDI